MGWGGPCGLLPITQKFSGNPYLKILNFSQLLVSDTPISFFSKFLFTPSDSTFGTFSKKIFFIFAIIQKIFLQTLVEIFRYHKKYF